MRPYLTLAVLSAMITVVRGGVLSVDLVGTGATNVNLTAEGSIDWVMLGRSGGAAGVACRDEKVDADFIGEVTVSGTHDSWDEHPSRFDWTDGSPTVIGKQVWGDWEAKPMSSVALKDQGLSFSVEGLAVGDYTMKLYTCSYKAGQQLTVSIGESEKTVSQELNLTTFITTYSVSFFIEKVGDSLDVSLNRNDGSLNTFSSVGISAISIFPTPKPGEKVLPVGKVIELG